MIPSTWAAFTRPEILETAEKLYQKAADSRLAGENIQPPQDRIFRALDLTPPETVRCVLLGQDPYPTPGVANGLAFSANPGQKIPASLRNIFKELSADLGCPMPSGPDLTLWAEQGVLLLNTVLTVRAGQPQSHAKWGWQSVTGDILRICAELPQPIVFLLWGRHAMKAAERIAVSDTKRILRSSHPSPLGANHGNAEIPAFLGSRPFSKTNRFLASMGGEPVQWILQ